MHLFGIVSDAGVHGLLEHLFACLELCRRRGLDRVFLHAFTDGRDTSPNSGLGYIRQIEAKMAEIGVGKVATVSGRYWAMDRDNRWPRVEKAYRAITVGEGPKFTSAEAAMQNYYDHPTEPNHGRRRVHHAIGHLRRRQDAARDRRRWRLGHLLQLSRRPPARNHQGVRPARISKDSTAAQSSIFFIAR